MAERAKNAGLGAEGGALPPELDGYVDKVARHAYRVTDEDVAAPRAAGHSEVFLRIIRLIAGRMPGPTGHELGKAFAACLQEAMRRSTEWTVGEVEVLAAFVSKLNRCAY